MSGLYNCLSCGHTASQAELGAAGATAPCPNCGRDMYRSQENGGLVAGSRGGARTTTALPSRYGGGGGAIGQYHDEDDDYDDEDHNPVLLRHTPLVVILGFIFSFLPFVCVGGLVISIMGYRLVDDNPRGLRGKGLAIAGIALGSLMTILSIILYINIKSR